ncbi:autotransporter-associated beta strand repeat-containing protein [Xanthobacter sediminis]
MLNIQSGTQAYPPGVSSSLVINFDRTTLDVGGAGAPGAVLSLGPAATLNFTGAVTPPVPGTLAAFLRVGYGGAGTLDIGGGTINVSAVTGASDPGRVVIGGGGGTGTSAVNMTDGLLAFSRTGTNYSGLAIGRTVGPAGEFNQSGGRVTVSGLLSADIGTEGGTGTYSLSGDAVFEKGAANALGVMYIGSRPNTGTGIAGSGTIHVSDTASFTFYSDNIFIGDARATGTIIQDGAGSQVYLQADNGVLFGSNNASGGGANGGGSGTYRLSAGTLTIAGNSQSATLGYAAGGSGTLEVSGGSATILGSAGLRLGAAAGATGTVTQTGGEVNAPVTFGAGVGNYSLLDGTLRTGSGITGGADDTFTLGGGTLNFLTGATTSSGFLTTLSAASTIEVDGTSAAWNSVISGAGGLTKTGAGILSLGGTNTGFTGNVTVSEGTLALTNAAALGAANGVSLLGAGTALDTSGLGTGAVAIGALNGSGALNLGNSLLGVVVPTGQTATYSGVITAGYTNPSTYGRIAKAGDGTLVINGATMADTAAGTGEFYVTQGTLEQSGGTTAIAYLDVGTGTTSGAANVGALTLSGGTLTVNRAFAVGSWGGSGTANQTGGTLVIPDPGDCSGCGGFYIGNQGGTGVYNLSGGTIDFTGGTFDLGRTGSISSTPFSGTLNVSGDGRIIARRGSIILGNWLVNATGGGSTTIGIGDGILNQSGGTIRVENTANLWLSARGDGTYNFTGGLLQIGGSSLHTIYPNAGGGGTYALNLGGGTIEVLGTALTTSAAATLLAGTTSTIDTNALGATWAGAITGSGALTKAGAGTLALAALATTGRLTIAGGTLASTANNSTGRLFADAGTQVELQITPGTTLALTGGSESVTAATIYGNSTLNVSGGGTLKVNGGSLAVGAPVTGSGPATASAGTLNLNGTTTIDLNAGATYTNLFVGRGGGVPSVAGTLVQNGSSTVTLGTNMIVGADGATGSYTLNGTSALNTGTGATSFVYVGLNQDAFTSGTSGTLTLNDNASFNLTDRYLYVAAASVSGGGGGDFAADGTIVQNGSSTVHLGGLGVYIGLDAGGTGQYQLNSGALTIDAAANSPFQVGARAGAIGILTQAGGALTANRAVTIGSAGSGTYDISGGTATFNTGLQVASGNGSRGTVNQSGGTVSVTAGGLAFGAGAGTYNLSGGTLVAQGAITGNIAGGDTFNFGGGTLQAGGALSANANFSTVIADGGTAVIDSNGFAITWNSAISGGGDLAKSGAGLLTLATANTFTGDVAVNGGTLALTNATALAAANGVSVASGATFDIGDVPAAPSSTYQTVNIGRLGGLGTIDVGDNALRVNIASSQTSSFAGTLVADESSWQSANFDNSLVKDGAGTLVIDGMSMTRGNLYAVNGTLSQTSGTTALTYLAVGEQAGSSGVLAATGGRVDIGEGLQVGDWGGTGVVNQSGGTVSLVATCPSPADCVAMNIGNQGGTGTYNLTGGQLLISGGSHSIGRNEGAQPASSGTLNISGSALMEVGPNGAFGTGFLVIGDRDPGTQANSTGVLNQNGGTLRFLDTARLYLGGYGSGTYNLNAGTLEIGGASLLGLYGGAGNTTGSYAFNLGGGTVKVIGTALNTGVTANLVSATTSTIDTNALGATLSGSLTGSGTLAKAGTGMLTLSGVNSGFTGAVSLAGGTLALVGASPLGVANTLGMGAGTVFDISGITGGAGLALGTLSGAGTVVTGLNRLTTGGGTFSGSITGGGGLTKVGAGTFTLGGINSYTGSTQVQGGTLAAGAANVFSQLSATTVGAGGTLDLGGFSQAIDTLALAGGTLRNGALAGAVISTGGTISGLGGTAALTIGAGLTTLSGSSSFSGPTQVSAGTLAVTGALTSSAVTVGSGASLTGSGSIGQAVTVEAGGALAGSSGATLSMGSLVLAPGAVINANLAAPVASPLFAVGGALTLDGTLHITSPSLDIGVTRLFSYGGALTDNGLAIGTLPAGLDASDILIAAGNGRVDVVNTDGAVLQYWNGAATLGPGTETVNGGSGTWSAANANWTDAAGAFNAPMQPQPGFAVFEGAAGVVTVDDAGGAVGAAGLQFITSGYVVQGDAIALSGTQATIRVGDGTDAGAATTATIAAALTGTGGLRKTDLGTLVLSGANSYAGTTLISAGTLALSGAGSIAASSGVIANGTFDISATTAGATVAALSGSGAVALGSRTLTIANAAGTFSGTIAGSGGLDIAAGTQTLTGTSSFGGGITFSGGSVAAGSAAALGSGTLGFVADGTLTVLGGFDVANAMALGAGVAATFDTGTNQAGASGPITGAGGLVKAGTGGLTLSAANSYSGGTTLQAGSLVLGNTRALGRGALTFAADGAVAFGVGGTFANAVRLASGVTGTFDTAGQTATLRGTITGDGTLGKIGDGTLNLASANGYTGGTILAQGTIGVVTQDALGSGALGVTGNASVAFGSSQTFANATTIAAGVTATFDTADNDVTLAGAVSGNGTLGKTGRGALTFASASSYAGGTILAGGTVILNDAAALGTGSVSVEESTRITVGFAAPFAYAVSLGGGTTATLDTRLSDITMAGGVSGAGGLNVTGGGTVALAVVNSYSGATTVSAGTLRSDVAGAFSSRSAFTVAGAAALDLGGTSQTIGSLAGAGAVHLGAATLTTGANDADTTFSGAMDGSGGLNKVGAGNFTISSASTYGGDTDILGGRIIIANANALGTGLINLSGSGTLAFAGAYTLANGLNLSLGGTIDTSIYSVTLAGDIGGAGGLTKIGDATLTLSGNNTFSGGIIVEAGTLGAATPQSLGTGAIDFQGASTFLLPDAALGPVTNLLNLDAMVALTPPTGGIAELDGVISGTGGISIAGAGTVILGGRNTYAGATDIGSGSTLRTSVPGALPFATALTVATGATLDLAGNSQSIGSLGGGGAVTLGSGTLTSGNNNADSLFTGTMSGAGGFNKVGTGTMVFDGTGDTGPATVSGGAFIVGGETGSTASFSAPVRVTGGGTIGGHGTVGPITVGSGGALSPGNSIGTLTTVGDLLLGPEATFLLEVNATQSDLLAVIGNAQLGGLLQIDTAAGWTANHAYVFLTTTGDVSGTFADVLDDLPLADAEITYGADSVALTLVPSLVPFTTLAATPNQASAAGAAQSLGYGNPIFDAILMLNAPAAQAAFGSLSGGAYPSAASLFLLDSRFIREATLARVRSPLDVSGRAEAAGSSGAWAQAVGSWGTLGGDANAPALSRTISGLFAGMDARVGDALRLGFATGYSQTSFDVTSISSSGTSDDYHVALYGAANFGLLDLRAGAAFTWHDVTLNRSVTFPGFIDQDRGDVSVRTGQLYAELALPWAFSAGTLEPFVNAAYVHNSMNGFSEGGGAAALTAQSQADDVVFTTLGARGAASFALGAIPASLRGTVGWQHAFGDLTPTAQFAFASGSLPFAIAGVSLPENALVLEGGLDFAITSQAAFSIVYSGLWGDNVSDNSLKGTLQIHF